MEDKLEKILKQISLNKENYEYFANGILEKVIIKDNVKLWEIIIKLDTNLPLDVYLELENKLRSTFSKIEIIRVRINASSTNYNELDKYFDEIERLGYVELTGLYNEAYANFLNNL